MSLQDLNKLLEAVASLCFSPVAELVRRLQEQSQTHDNDETSSHEIEIQDVAGEAGTIGRPEDVAQTVPPPNGNSGNAIDVPFGRGPAFAGAVVPPRRGTSRRTSLPDSARTVLAIYGAFKDNDFPEMP